jgi:hypothetical protein
MSARSLMLIAAVAAPVVAATAAVAVAQTPPPAQRTRASSAPVPRIEINPRQLLYRRCNTGRAARCCSRRRIAGGCAADAYVIAGLGPAISRKSAPCPLIGMAGSTPGHDE